MDELIRRSDAIKAIIEYADTHTFNSYNKGMHKAVSIIEDIPSADRPRGEWIDKGRNLWECSNCKMEIYSESEQDRSEFHKWCSRCGARMKGADDEDN